MRREEGAFLAMAADLSNRHYCHMHKFSSAKKCERPSCNRYIFPQDHPDAEIIGKAILYPGKLTQEVCDKMVRRYDHLVFRILRSQNPYLARKLLDKMREAEADKHVEDDATNNIDGIKVVTGTIKKQVCDSGANKRTERHIIIDDDDNETLNPDYKQ